MNKKSIGGLWGGALFTGMRWSALSAFVRAPSRKVNHPRRVAKTTAAWKKILTADQFYVTRQEGTERPFTSPLTVNHAHGEFRCVNCHEPLFTSATKFESGTG